MSRCDPSGPRSFPWRSLGHAGLLALCLLPCAALPAASQPAHIALVIGNGAYTTPSAMAPLPGCPVSARYVATALRHLGYDVTDQYDLGLGPLDAAVGSFARRLHDSPDAAAVVYVCGGLSSLNARPFLLPVSARLERPSDVLTQGVLARTVLNAMVAGHVQVGLIALDGFVSPTAASPDADVKTLTDAATTAGIGMAISLPKPTDSATPLSAALIAELAGPQVKLAAVLDGLHTRITNDVLVGLTMPAPAGRGRTHTRTGRTGRTGSPGRPGRTSPDDAGRSRDDPVRPPSRATRPHRPRLLQWRLRRCLRPQHPRRHPPLPVRNRRRDDRRDHRRTGNPPGPPARLNQHCRAVEVDTSATAA